MKILLVCLGNICRSPMAEGIMRNKIKQRNLSVIVDSAGTSDYHVNDRPDKRAIETSKCFNIDISGLRGRQFSVSDFDNFDRIYAMDKANQKDILKLARNNKDREKVYFFITDNNEGVDVPDPWFGEESGFTDVFKLLDERCTIILDSIEEEIKSGSVSK